MGVCFTNVGLCFTKMGVNFFENSSLFFENGSLFFRKWEFVLRKWEFVFSKMGVRFFVCDLQCDLLNSGRRLSRPMSVALSGYTLVTVLFN